MAPYPVHLDLHGRKVLLVGAGKVAARRIDRFLRAGARVIVVAPEALPAIRRLAARGRIELRRRAFAPADVRGMWLVHAATDDPKVNRAVLAAVRAIRRRGATALASVADASWTDGDFVIPASFEHDGMVVSVGSRVGAGTGGRLARRADEPSSEAGGAARAPGRAGEPSSEAGGAARSPGRAGEPSSGAGGAARARDLKNLLARQLAAVSATDLVIVAAERKRLGARAFAAMRRAVGTEKRLAAVLSALRPVDEFLVVVAPNYCAAWMLAGADPSVIELARHAMGLDGLPRRSCTVLRGAGAFDHLARLLAGARSGGRSATGLSRAVRRALLAARAGGTAGPRLAALLQRRGEARSR
ncbi:MAG: hypothetical protein HY825_20530 [Acidobacteria bacterium]|nr:hypothetical protein [Acidobacteriota bacterium]